jgi:RNA polymerase primary sigma factor
VGPDGPLDLDGGARDRSAGDIETRNRVVQENLGLVFPVARQYVNRGLTLEDLVAEGNLGLIRAAESYDARFGTRFSTYAVFHIKDAIQSALARTGTTIRLPMNVARLLERWRRAERSLCDLRGHRPSAEEVAGAMGLDEPSRRLVEQAQRVVRVQMQHALSDTRFRLEWRTTDCGARPDEALAAEEERQYLARRVERLEPQQRAIIRLKYGLGGEPPLSVEQIRERLGLTKAAVEKLVAIAIRRLAAPARA